MEVSYLYSGNIAAWRPFSFNKRKRQALTIMNPLLRRECTHPKEMFLTVLEELAVMLSVNSFNSQMAGLKRGKKQGYQDVHNGTLHTSGGPL